MAPEHAEDPRGIDTRADICSFGAIFYHALTGEPPFQGKSAFSVLFKHKTEPLIPPKVRNPLISDRTSELLERCLAKSPSERFTSFAEITKILHSGGESASPWEVLDEPWAADHMARFQARKRHYLDRTMTIDSADVYAFPGDKRLTIRRGDIVDEDVDALVNSTYQSLDLMFGDGLAIGQGGGPELLEECRPVAAAFLPKPGRAVVTTGGRLKARFVLHGITLGYSAGYAVLPSRDLVVEIIRNCFYHADSLGLRSIAFPLLGTGAAGFGEDICLETMFRHLIKTLARTPTSVDDIRIILFDRRWPQIAYSSMDAQPADDPRT